jgi:hypothetical protein
MAFPVHRRMLFLLLAHLAAVSVRADSLPVELQRQSDRVEVLIGGQPFGAFYFGPESPKPYFHPLRSASGVVVTRGFPMITGIPGESTDHPHHRAMFFAHGDVNGTDFWAEPASFAAEAHVAGGVPYGSSAHLPLGKTVLGELEEVWSGKESGSLRALFHLVNQDGKVIGELAHTYTFRGDAKTRTVDCDFTVRALRAPLKFGDTKEGTFAIRVVKGLEEPAARMTDSEGRVGEKQVWGKRAKWVDYSGVVEGKRVGIAIFDHPSNPRHPTYWHARGYGLFAVNPFGERDFHNDKSRDGSLTVPPGETLTFRYRVLIHEGDAEAAGVAAAYAAYARLK